MREDEVRIWVELETLLDVRLALIHLIDPDATPVVLKNGYDQRPIDDWEKLSLGRVSNSVFSEAYRDRNKGVLKEAVPTRMNVYLKQLCKEIIDQRDTTPFGRSVHVEVNTWPYEFSSDEKEVLCAMVGFYVGEEVKVTTRYKTLEYLTPKRLRDDYSAVILYDFNEWFRFHHKALEEGGCPRTVLFAAALFIGEVPDPDFLKDSMSAFSTNDPFRLLEMSLVAKIHLQFLNIDYYTPLPPKKPS